MVDGGYHAPEVMETIYRWHEGRKIRQISRSPGIDRKTVRKYPGVANEDTGLKKTLEN
jgi:hypothetical protein